MPWVIPKKISLLAVAILFLFPFFNLILDAPHTLHPWLIFCPIGPLKAWFSFKSSENRHQINFFFE
jgi:hypothetical protein